MSPQEAKPRICASIEARMGSLRLPGKVMLPLAGAPTLQRLVERIRGCHQVDEVIIATTTAPEDLVIASLADQIGCPVHRGSVEDITARLLGAAAQVEADVLVQLTGDCPLVGPDLVDPLIRLLLETHADYASNHLVRTFPLGIDARAFPVAALKRAADMSQDPVDRSHGSWYLHCNPGLFSHASLEADGPLQRRELRLTVDYPEDYEVVRRIFDHLHPQNPLFSAQDVLDLMDANPGWASINADCRQKRPEEM